MNRECPYCASAKVQSRGTKTNQAGSTRNRYQCVDCNKWFSVILSEAFVEPVKEVKVPRFSSPMPEDYARYSRFVISAVQNDTEVNEEFLHALQNYCKVNKAKLILVPIKYKATDESTYEVDSELLVEGDVLLSKKLRLLANVQITPTIETPLAGLDILSKGNSLIIAHPQLQMKTIATLDDSPAQLYTTGAITYANYAPTKTGEKAKFNHSLSALVIEKDHDQFYCRVLNCDDNNRFYDLDRYYGPTGVSATGQVEALITGDEHAMFTSEAVKRATYLAEDSIANVLKPKKIVRHDVLDFFTGSHHHQHSFLLQYAKHRTKTNDIESELSLTLRHIAETTPEWAENIMVASNHVEHMNKWLDTIDPKQEVWNAKLYYRMMYLMIEHIDRNGIDIPNAFRMWCENTHHEFDYPQLRWLGRNEQFKIHGIELSNHGDMGINGARGSPVQFSRLPDKMVVGHSHSPSIVKGCYTVGTSTGRLEYTKGPSSWANTHCIIYPNGKRQLVTIINGKWKL